MRVIQLLCRLCFIHIFPLTLCYKLCYLQLSVMPDSIDNKAKPLFMSSGKMIFSLQHLMSKLDFSVYVMSTISIVSLITICLCRLSSEIWPTRVYLQPKFCNRKRKILLNPSFWLAEGHQKFGCKYTLLACVMSTTHYCVVHVTWQFPFVDVVLRTKIQAAIQFSTDCLEP